MIYYLLFSDNKEELESSFSGEVLEYIVAKDLREAQERAVNEMRERGFKYCLIFTFGLDGEPIKLHIQVLEDEVIKVLGRWFS